MSVAELTAALLLSGSQQPTAAPIAPPARVVTMATAERVPTPSSVTEPQVVLEPVPGDATGSTLVLEQPAPPAQDATPAAPLVIAPPTPPPVPVSMYLDAPVAATANGQQTPGAITQADPRDDIVVVGRAGHPPGDPLEAINEQSFAITQKADTAFVAPASRVYRSIVPRPARDGLGNVFRNLHEPDNFLNFLLQHKIGKALETVARFAINSTIGVLGLFDFARRKPFNLPRRRNSLSNTLGFYGVGPGPFFFLPLVGPTTVRDFFGNAIDGLVLPTAVGKPFTGTTYTIPSSVFRSLDHRVKIDDKLKEIKASPNPYSAARDYYLAQRQAEIDQLRGRGGSAVALPATTPPVILPGTAPLPPAPDPSTASNEEATVVDVQPALLILALPPYPTSVH